MNEQELQQLRKELVLAAHPKLEQIPYLVDYITSGDLKHLRNMFENTPYVEEVDARERLMTYERQYQAK